MSDRLGSTLAALVAGAAIGVGIGILFAPDEGKKTRKKIRRSFDESKDELSHKIDDLKKQVRSVVDRKSNTIEDGIEDFINSAGKKRDEVISALEQKLAELKKQSKELAESTKK
ncbi:YtxH domain-containing protein [Myroides sp. WP-1]|uniref:YtxH domain-containing protein n=1 Tax=Myroides sp. WP-1 TaxID=2759944 RepID=UPI0015F8F546|nr:YtxH domain-containing protein [Myroides sp. WP-1]MBB1139418.1 YtxH domain-containing protein [Myroides sp. WP-1]